MLKPLAMLLRTITSLDGKPSWVLSPMLTFGLQFPGIGNQAVVENRIVDDLAAMHARVADAPTGAGHDHVVDTVRLVQSLSKASIPWR